MKYTYVCYIVSPRGHRGNFLSRVCWRLLFASAVFQKAPDSSSLPSFSCMHAAAPRVSSSSLLLLVSVSALSLLPFAAPNASFYSPSAAAQRLSCPSACRCSCLSSCLSRPPGRGVGIGCSSSSCTRVGSGASVGLSAALVCKRIQLGAAAVSEAK